MVGWLFVHPNETSDVDEVGVHLLGRAVQVHSTSHLCLQDAIRPCKEVSERAVRRSDLLGHLSFQPRKGLKGIESTWTGSTSMSVDIHRALSRVGELSSLAPPVHPCQVVQSDLWGRELADGTCFVTLLSDWDTKLSADALKSSARGTNLER